MNTENLMERYHRQLIVPEIGQEGQSRLLESAVLVVGAGGLGNPALLYLNAAGIGTLGIADGDTVDISNLQRQVLFEEADIGKNKAQKAKKHLELRNSNTKLEAFDFFLTQENILHVIENFDVVLDCTDNFEARYLLSQATQKARKPLVFAAISEYEAQISIFNGEKQKTYHDLFPAQRTDDNQEALGVVGFLPGIAGAMQAAEAIKFITQAGKTLDGKLLIFNAFSFDYTILKL